MGAVTALEQALRTETSLPQVTREVGTLAVSYYLGAALYAAGEHERAGEMMQQAAEAARATGIDAATLTFFFGGGAPALAITDRAAAIALLTSNLREVRLAHLPRGLEDWVSGAAGVLALAGDHARAARLLSWVRSRTVDQGIPPTSPAQYVVNRYNVQLVREALGREEALRCREDGRALSEDEAVATALEGLEGID